MKAGFQVIHAYPANYKQSLHFVLQKNIQYDVNIGDRAKQCGQRPSSRTKLTMDEEGSQSPCFDYSLPIIGYEIVEKRQRFTVYKIHVKKQTQSWFVFRRYSDFEQLHKQLMSIFPTVKLNLPPKDSLGITLMQFIAKRAQGLQNFIHEILQHFNIKISREICEFFCLHDPPGPFDSIEESRAYVQFLEEQLENTKSVVIQLNSQLEQTKCQLNEARSHIRRLKFQLRKRQLPDPPRHSTPLVDCSKTHDVIDSRLSCLLDSTQKTRKTVSFAKTKSASEGNLLVLKRKENSPKSQFRHSITFGEDCYNRYLKVDFHSSVTRNTKGRKGNVGKEKRYKKHKTVYNREKQHHDKSSFQSIHKNVTINKRDGDNIRESCTE